MNEPARAVELRATYKALDNSLGSMPYRGAITPKGVEDVIIKSEGNMTRFRHEYDGALNLKREGLWLETSHPF